MCLDDGRVIEDIVAQVPFMHVLKKEPLTVYGDLEADKDVTDLNGMQFSDKVTLLEINSTQNTYTNFGLGDPFRNELFYPKCRILCEIGGGLQFSDSVTLYGGYT